MPGHGARVVDPRSVFAASLAYWRGRQRQQQRDTIVVPRRWEVEYCRAETAALKAAPGRAVMAAITKCLRSGFGHIRRQPNQRKMHDAMLSCCAMFILGANYDEYAHRKLQESGRSRLPQELMLSSSRRAGKTTGVAMFAAALAICSDREVGIVIFSVTLPGARNMLRMIETMIHLHERGRTMFTHPHTTTKVTLQGPGGPADKRTIECKASKSPDVSEWREWGRGGARGYSTHASTNSVVVYKVDVEAYCQTTAYLEKGGGDTMSNLRDDWRNLPRGGDSPTAFYTTLVLAGFAVLFWVGQILTQGVAEGTGVWRSNAQFEWWCHGLAPAGCVPGQGLSYRIGPFGFWMQIVVRLLFFVVPLVIVLIAPYQGFRGVFRVSGLLSLLFLVENTVRVIITGARCAAEKGSYENSWCYNKNEDYNKHTDKGDKYNHAGITWFLIVLTLLQLAAFTATYISALITFKYHQGAPHYMFGADKRRSVLGAAADSVFANVPGVNRRSTASKRV